MAPAAASIQTPSPVPPETLLRKMLLLFAPAAVSVPVTTWMPPPAPLPVITSWMKLATPLDCTSTPVAQLVMVLPLTITAWLPVKFERVIHCTPMLAPAAWLEP